MKIDLNKIEFDMNEFGALLLQDKQEGFRRIGEKFLNAVLEMEFAERIGAQKHERTGEREDYRNGHKERRLKTTLGELNLLRPYARVGKFDTKLFANYSRIDKALSSIIVESYLKGVSTRKVESIVGELGIELSHETVSRLSHELDELVTEFKTSDLQEHYPYLYIDATYLKVFDGVRFVSSAVMVAIGVNTTGTREILDITPMESESFATYTEFFDGLKDRGIKKVDLIISDGHRGIKKAAKESFVGSSWQFCSVHLKRNLMKIVAKKDLEEVLDDLKEVLKSKSFEEAISAANSMIATYEDSKPRLAKFLMDNLYDSCTYLTFPSTHWRKLHSTNIVERFNKEIKRRTKVIGAFPNEGSILRLLVPLAIDTNAKWLGRNYVSWDNLVQFQKAEDEFTEIF
ncbi:IS256 family transposase [Sulfurimonas sediminis]|uniref:Mutator family transposase n=1 Tax=Sulfurimonas sediminis TaxID=2590020 RepID=A0A7M1B1V8_9BACT|nr:IS256 family transposase [Sulfurimonas sediminis]QOP43749.1 IS256 family transposase [Sulfurimonas sediminis]